MDGLSVFKKAVNNDKYPLSKFLRDGLGTEGWGWVRIININIFTYW